MTVQPATYDFEQSDVIPASPTAIYETWMSSEGHTAMTGGEAVVDPRVGGTFTAWDDYITGRTLELEPGRRILQSWRTSEFTDREGDSHIEVLLEAVDGGTLVRLRHSGVPVDHRGYEDGGWRDNYFEPMKTYFAERSD
jgi:activator of HSP90 ATPase